MRALLALFLVTAVMYSCRPPEDPTALITVFGENGEVAPGIGVRIYTEGDLGDGIYNLLDSTNGRGQAIFDFSGRIKPGQEGFVVFQVRTIESETDSSEQGVIIVRDEGISEKQITLE